MPSERAFRRARLSARSGGPLAPSRAVGVVVAAALLASLAACAGTLDEPERFREGGASSLLAAEAGAAPASACVPVETGILQPRCASAGCHAAASSAAGLDLASPDVLVRLANQAVAGGAGSLIVPGNPAASVLYMKLAAPPPFGSRMPVGVPLDEATRACVRDWIATAAR